MSLYIAHDNLATANDPTITVRNENSAYPADNLSQNGLYPVYRTDAKVINLDGLTEYLYAADDASLDITGDLSVEFAICPTLAIVGFDAFVIHKMDATTGYAISYETGGDLRFYIDNTLESTYSSALTTDTWYRVKLVYDASAGEAKWYINGTLQETDTGLPNSITANNVRLTVGANSSGAEAFYGKIAWIAINDSELDHGGYIPANGGNTQAYWDFNDSSNRLADSSQNSNDLTAVSIDNSNYEPGTVFHVVSFMFGSTETPGYFFIDRRHNLTSTASVKWIKSSPWTQWTVQNSTTATASTPIIMTDTTTGVTTWGFEIHDPDNTNDYLEIPYFFLGDKVTLTETIAYNQFNILPFTSIVQNANPLGNFRTYQLSDEAFKITGTISTFLGNLKSSGDDFTKLHNAMITAQKGIPEVWCFDDRSTVYENAYTFLGYWTNANGAAFAMQVGSQTTTSNDEQYNITINFQETAAEAS